MYIDDRKITLRDRLRKSGIQITKTRARVHPKAICAICASTRFKNLEEHLEDVHNIHFGSLCVLPEREMAQSTAKPIEPSCYCIECHNEIYVRCLEEHLDGNCPSLNYLDLIQGKIELIQQGIITLPFVILPAGTSGRRIAQDRYVEVQKTSDQRVDLSREEFIESLNPLRRYQGASAWNKYMAYEFERSRVVLESPLTGNAVFLLEGNWMAMISKSKSELLADYPHCTDRFTHTGPWRQYVTSFVRTKDW